LGGREAAGGAAAGPVGAGRPEIQRKIAEIQRKIEIKVALRSGKNAASATTALKL
jgi:hypothetical protein